MSSGVGRRLKAARMGLQWWAVDRAPLNRMHSIASGRRQIWLGPDTELVVEGYPRSANTLLSQGLMVMNPWLRVATHSHGLGVVRRAAGRAVPVVITLRNPDEAIPSCAAYLGIDLGSAAIRYAKFHEAIADLRLPSILFETLTTDGPATGDFLRAAFGRPLAWPNGEQEYLEMQDLMTLRFGEHPPTPAGLVSAARREYGSLAPSLRRRAAEAYEAAVDAGCLVGRQ